jgi:hypothetical protein
MVEFAVLAPLFLTLSLGVIEAGQALEASNIMAAAVREGGRLACMDYDGIVGSGQTPNQKVIADVRNFLLASKLPGNDATIRIVSAEGADSGQTFDLSVPANQYRLFKIDVSIPYSEISVFPVTFMQGQTITASLIFRCGRVAGAG